MSQVAHEAKEQINKQKLDPELSKNVHKTLADPGGAAGAPPNRINFFRFRIHFCQKVYVSEVGAPPNGFAPPQREILDPPLQNDNSSCIIWDQKVYF